MLTPIKVLPASESFALSLLTVRVVAPIFRFALTAQATETSSAQRARKIPAGQEGLLLLRAFCVLRFSERLLIECWYFPAKV